MQGWRSAQRLWPAVRRDQSGQHSAEFAVLIGTVALAVVGVQHIAQRAIQQGVVHVSNTAFDPPPAADPDEGPRDLDVISDNRTEELGRDDFSRRTESAGRVVGHTVNEDAQCTGCQALLPDAGRP
ncbi:MAG: hypothetical protein COV75_03115 [Candidatus Omnitrophica bacterium CG11_big_fil_rev_8_21_14_0_20_63_9]|nr:MAG: hypothetical protein COV75_03115 [Candidatus Omnitrophica bacterium CG11_big_fil_rev_8_21_14_0_20_63_9]